MNGLAYTSNTKMEQIDSEISTLETAIRQLRSRRNTLASISKLPEELLCAIFMFCSLGPSVDTPKPMAYHYSPNGNRWHWISVTHVCHHWRSAALSCPTLWSRPEFNRTELAHEMIKRSREALLTIEVASAWYTPRVLDAVTEGLRHLGRIEKIHLQATREHIPKLLAPLIESSISAFQLHSSTTLTPNEQNEFESKSRALALHTLFLEVGPSDRYYNSMFVPFVLLPPDFLASGAPNLRHLELHHVYLAWDSLLFRNLTFLKVINLNSHAPTESQLFGALREMPALEELDLEGVLPNSSLKTINTKESLASVSLTHLRYLRFVGTVDGCAFFLMNVYIPSVASLQLKGHCSEQPNKDSAALRLISEVCRRVPLLQAETMEQEQRKGKERARDDIEDTTSLDSIESMLVRNPSSAGSGFSIEARSKLCSNTTHSRSLSSSSSNAATSWPIALSSYYPFRAIPPNLKLEFTWPSGPPNLTRTTYNAQLNSSLADLVLNAVCLPLQDSLRDLRSLHVKTVHDLSPALRIDGVFGALRKVEELTVHGNGVGCRLVDVLGLDRLEQDVDDRLYDDDAAATRVVFPSLRTLKLLDVDFSRYVPNKSTTTNATQSGSLAPAQTSASSSESPSAARTRTTQRSSAAAEPRNSTNPLAPAQTSTSSALSRPASPSSSSELSDSKNISSPPLLDPLCTLLMQRRKANAPLHQLHLAECVHLSSSAVDRLKDIVGVPDENGEGGGVHWDGYDRASYDDEDDEDDSGSDSDEYNYGGMSVDDFGGVSDYDDDESEDEEDRAYYNMGGMGMELDYDDDEEEEEEEEEEDQDEEEMDEDEDR